MRRIFRVALFCLLLALIAGIVMPLAGLNGRDFMLTRAYDRLPAPWLIPKKSGEAVLHIAMVHDVIHERFQRHGKAWYEARIVRIQAGLAAQQAPSDEELALMDDLAVSHERLGHPEEGIPILRRKLAIQLAAQPDGQGRPFYTTYANLGTLLIHANIKSAIAGEEPGIAGLREGLGFIRAAMAANPDAHFGRETWQAEAVEALLADIREPQRVTRLDLVGLSLGTPQHNRLPTGRGTAGYERLLDANGGFEAVQARCAAGDQELRDRVRGQIPQVMRYDANGGTGRLPFDEPTLGLVGMWTLGGGANPHSALALGHLMEAVHQRRIAWDAYERAVELGAGFWPDAGLRAGIVAHCRDRQQAIEAELGEGAEALRQRHQAELAVGLDYRKAYQDHEAAQLAAGRSQDDPELMRDFFASHPPIATKPGDEDSYLVERPARLVDLLVFWIGGLSGLILLAIGLEALDRRRHGSHA